MEQYKNETEEKTEQVSKKILMLARNELYLRMHFMDVALSSFEYVRDDSVFFTATDGFGMYYNPSVLGGTFKKSRIEVNRAYLHMVLHCIFRHMIKRKGRREDIWNLACDIAVGSVADSLNVRGVKKGQSWLRQKTYRKLAEKNKVLTAERVYRELEAWELPERDFVALMQEFTVDDHKYWAKDEEKNRESELNKKWQDISEQMQTDMETFSQEASSNAGNMLRQVQVENKERYDYRSFLKKFAVLKEEMSVDEDTFDYIFYTYGLSLYGNMPLVEPQEWKEVKKVEDFVIVIDTSMSCSGELVKNFLEETYGILSENDSFFQKVNIHILQCDEEVQRDKKITCQKELKEYMENLELAGEGGTDFRPAFAYINQMIEDHRFERLKGVIYFTDGQGVFPNKRPVYETAFVFMRSDYEDAQVPPWAMKLILEEEELREYGH